MKSAVKELEFTLSVTSLKWIGIIVNNLNIHSKVDFFRTSSNLTETKPLNTNAAAKQVEKIKITPIDEKDEAKYEFYLPSL